MIIKKTIKRFGRHFIDLEQKDEKIISQSVLIVDNGYGWLGHVEYVIERIRKFLPKAEISVLTFGVRKSNLEENFPKLKFIIPSEDLRPKRYQIALQMLKKRKAKYDFLVLFSLDITPLIISLIFMKSKRVILYNQWRQWWILRLRKTTEIFKVTYISKRTRINLKNTLKKIGLFFILLQSKDEEIFKHSVLVIDNGYAAFGQIGYAIQCIKESLPGANISLLSLRQRNELIESFPELEIIRPDNCIIKKYRIARHLLRLKNNRYDYIILLSLDVTPLALSILFMKSKVLLNNQWHQWWLLTPRPFRDYLMAIPKFVLTIIINIVVFVYLLISVSWIFLKKSFTVFKFNLLAKRP
ncbi:MAG: hypothetical protein PVI33_06670 [Candidatus Omnitrophota bacterium]|jgi:hypothetical protein